jgi:hypothetical protein
MIPTGQVTVSLLLAEGGDPKGFRRSRKWAAAFALAAKELKKRKAKKFVKLELPNANNDGLKAWHVVKNGIPYRCLYQYRIMPHPAGWNGRVDVGYIA